MLNSVVSYARQNPRRLFYALGIFWLVIGLGGTFWHYYSTGTITITTNDNISEIQITQTANPAVTKHATGQLHARLAPGTYSVLTSNKTASTRRVVNVKVRSNSVYTVTLVKPLETEPALSFGAFSIVADNSHVRYVDMRDSQLYSLSSTSAPVAISPAISLKSVKWISVDFGIGLSEDGHRLYSLRSGVASQIDLPFNDTAHLSYDISTDQSLLVSDGISVYVTATNGGFAKLYSTDSSSTIQSVRGGNNRLFIGLSHNTRSSKDDDSSYLLNDLKGNTIAKLNHTSIYSSNWSPNGKQLVVADPSGTIIYNDSLVEVSRLSDKNALGVTWLNDKSLLYGLDDGLYQYDLGSSSSKQLVSVGGGRAVSGVYVSQDQQHIFIVIGDAGANRTHGFTVSKVDLKANQYPLTARLSALFPLQLDECSAQLVNFFSPIVVINPYSPLSVDSCRQTIVSDISKIEASGTGYQIVANAVDLGAD